MTARRRTSRCLGLTLPSRFLSARKTSRLGYVRRILLESLWSVAEDPSRDVLLGERLAARLSERRREMRFLGALAGEWNTFDRGAARTIRWLRRLRWPRKFWQAWRGKAHLRQRADQAGGCAGEARPKELSGAIYDRWYCSPYPQSIAFQLAEAIPIRTRSRFGRWRRMKAPC